MSTELDLDDVAATSRLAKRELDDLRLNIANLRYALRDIAELGDTGYGAQICASKARAALGMDEPEDHNE